MSLKMDLEILLNALDEDALTSAVLSVSDQFGVDKNYVLDKILRFHREGFIEFYCYDENGGFVDVDETNLRDVLKEKEFGVFMAHNEKIFEKIKEINSMII